MINRSVVSFSATSSLGKIFMKRLLFLLLMTILAAPPVLSQTRKAGKSKNKRPAPAAQSPKTVNQPVATDEEPPPPPPAPKASSKERLSSDVFKTAVIGKWGVDSLSLPDDLTNETESSTPTTNKNVSWTKYAHYWKQPAKFYPSSLEVDLYITTWNADFKTIIPDLKPELATPENLILIDIAGDTKNKNTPGSSVKESKSLQVGGVDGGFFLADSALDKKRFTVGWSTYRYFENRAQNIMLTITGRRDELQKALKIIESLKLQSEQKN